MNEARRLESDPSAANGPLTATPGGPTIFGRDDRLAGWSAELEHRIELLEEDVTLLFKAVGLAGLREHELLLRLGLPDDTLQRDHAKLLAQAAVPPRGKARSSTA